MDDGQEQYVHQVLEAYRKTPGTMGTIRRSDRVLLPNSSSAASP